MPLMEAPNGFTNGVQKLGGSVDSSPHKFDRTKLEGFEDTETLCCHQWPTIKKILTKLFLPVGMLIIVVFGAAVPDPGKKYIYIYY